MFQLKNSSTHTTASQIPLVPVRQRESSTSEFLLQERNGSKRRFPEGWSNGPRTLQSSVIDSVFEHAFDLVVVACSLTFLVFGFLVRQYDQAPVSEHVSLVLW